MDRTIRRTNVVSAVSADFALTAGLAASGMMLVFGLLYATAAIGAWDPFLL